MQCYAEQCRVMLNNAELYRAMQSRAAMQCYEEQYMCKADQCSAMQSSYSVLYRAMQAIQVQCNAMQMKFRCNAEVGESSG